MQSGFRRAAIAALLFWFGSLPLAAQNWRVTFIDDGNSPGIVGVPGALYINGQSGVTATAGYSEERIKGGQVYRHSAFSLQVKLGSQIQARGISVQPGGSMPLGIRPCNFYPYVLGATLPECLATFLNGYHPTLQYYQAYLYFWFADVNMDALPIQDPKQVLPIQPPTSGDVLFGVYAPADCKLANYDGIGFAGLPSSIPKQNRLPWISRIGQNTWLVEAIDRPLGIVECGFTLVAGKGKKTSCTFNSSTDFYTNPVRIRMVWERF
jgi:hypothetical protein